MKIFLVLNLNTKEKVKRGLEAIERLSPYHELSLSITQAFEMERPELISFDSEHADLIMSIGGDGTLLKAAHLAYSLHKPVLGVNAGNVGALCAYRYEELDGKDPLKGCHKEERRGIEFRAKNLSGFALNEVVVTSYSRAKCALLSLEIQGKEYQMKGDGFIASSPTGSTAYNRSLGGPTLPFGEDRFVFMPLAPIQDELRKPFVLDDGEVVAINNLDRGPFPAPVIVYDGMDAGVMKGEMKVRLSRHVVTLYRR